MAVNASEVGTSAELERLRQQCARLEARLERTRAAKQQMETASERGLRKLYLREQELKLLQGIATAANLSETVGDAFGFALRKLCEFMAWPASHAYIVVGSGGAARLQPMRIWYARDPERIDAFRHATEGHDLALSDGLPGRVHALRKPAWVTDIAADAAFLRTRVAVASGIRSACAFPILIGEEVVAVFEFFTDRPSQPDDALLRLLPQAGPHLARVIERERAKEQLVHDATHDHLTMLPNRAFFLERLGESVAHSKRHAGAQFAVLFIDLDRFKLVNDSLGHLAGDRLISQVASRLQHALRQGDWASRSGEAATASRGGTLARLGGDEFTVLLDDIADPSDAIRIAKRIGKTIAEPFTVDGQELYTTASIGIATSGSAYRNADEVLRDADIAMYRAKSAGKGCCELFDKKMHQVAVKRLELETDLRKALQNDEFVVHYQPVVSLRTQRIVGLEALVRWQRPDGQLVYPDNFIGVVEDMGLIVFLGEWVLREACRTACELRHEFPDGEPLHMNVNVSARQFAQPNFVDQVRRAIVETEVDPHCLQLEITETMTIGDTRRITQVLRDLKDLGVRLSIDDFGTGYSSLSYLHSLPLDTLKLDRSFVAAMEQSEESAEIVHTVMTLGRNLKMEVIAEGAEEPEQVARLKSLGYEMIQGYYFSRPVDRKSVTALLQHPEAMQLKSQQALQQSR